jgi:hypothetical protein
MIWVYTELKSIDENSQKLGNKPFLDNARDVFKIIKNFKKDINNIS